MLRRRAIVTTLAVAIAFVATQASQAPIRAQTAEDWRLSVMLMTKAPRVEPGSALLWVGLRNESAVPRLLCVGGYSYYFKHPERPAQEASGSPHACGGATAYTIVRPGETHFYPIVVDERVIRLDTVVLDVDVFASDADVSSPDTPRPLELEWSGTTREALAAGRTLQSTAPR